MEGDSEEGELIGKILVWVDCVVNRSWRRNLESVNRGIRAEEVIFTETAACR